VVTTEARCDALRGVYAGDGIDCDKADCDSSVDCACDWNGDGVLNLDDLRAFMEDFANGDADFDGDGDTDSDDVMAFLGCIRDC
jgi:hypothetical protein